VAAVSRSGTEDTDVFDVAPAHPASTRRAARRVRQLTLAVSCGAVLGAVPAAARRAQSPAPPAPAPSGAPDDVATQVEMHNVHFVVAQGIVLRIRNLHGEMRSKRGGPVVFDDKESFEIHLRSAEVGLTAADLGALMNDYVFAYKGSPLKRLVVTVHGKQIRQRGVMHKVVDIPFDITADVSAMPDGRIRIHPTDTRIFHVEGDGLMRALGVRLDKLLDLRGSKGASVKGNDIFLEPDSLLPAPTIRGHVTAVRIDGDELVQQFGPPERAPSEGGLHPPDKSAENYMFYRGGTLRFGKLLMLDAEMQIVDADPKDPFRFDIDHYSKQLVAGYSRTLPSMGLEVFMPDIDDAERPIAVPKLAVPPRH
jgi:hypothetical protein